MFFDDICFELLKIHPFYAQMLRQCKITIDNKFEAPAGVVVKHGIEMIINQEKMAKLPLREQAGIVEHELAHLFHDHIADYQKVGKSEASLVGKKRSHKAFNVAADAQINTKIKPLYDSPERGIEMVRKVAKAGKEHGFKSDKFKQVLEDLKADYTWVFPESFDMRDGEHWTTYYKGLLLKYQPDEDQEQQMMVSMGDPGDQNEDQDGDSQSGKGMPQDGMPEGYSHQYFELSIEDQEVLDEVVSNAAKQAKEMNYGHAPQMVEEYFIQVEKRKRLPWHVILRQFIASQVSIHKKSTWKKSNRRFPEQMPGHKRDPKLKLLIGVDASGSVGDKAWATFFNEVNGIHLENAELWIAEFDTQVVNYYKYTGTPEKRRTCGGTDFRPVHQKMIEGKFQGLIMFTDGYGSFPEKKDVHYRSLWVIDGDFKAPYGHSIKIEVPTK